MTTRLLFIRHAESRHSVAGTVGGPRTDAGLTPRGHSQAAALGTIDDNPTRWPPPRWTLRRLNA